MTPEELKEMALPWRVFDTGIISGRIYNAKDTVVAHGYLVEMNRIVDCVNACQDLPEPTKFIATQQTIVDKMMGEFGQMSLRQIETDRALQTALDSGNELRAEIDRMGKAYQIGLETLQMVATTIGTSQDIIDTYTKALLEIEEGLKAFNDRITEL